MRRSVVLATITAFAFVLTLIVWSGDPDSQTPQDSASTFPDQPGSVTDVGQTPIAAPSTDTRPSAAQDCEIEPDWLVVGPSRERVEAFEAKLDGAMAFAADVFAESQDVDELVFALELSSDETETLEQYARAIEAGSRSPYLLWKAVIACIDSQGGSAAACPLDDWFALQARLDADNSEVWMQRAGYAFRTGDDEAGMAALEKAAYATTTSIYFTRDVRAFKRGLEATGQFNSRETTSLAFGIGNLPSFSLYAEACKDRSMTDQRRLELCDQYAANVLSRPTTAIVQGLAESIQIFTFQARGMIDNADALQQIREQRNKDAIGGIERAQARELFQRSIPDQFHNFVDDIDRVGEYEAFRRLNERIDKAGLDDFMMRCESQIEAYRDAIEAMNTTE